MSDFNTKPKEMKNKLIVSIYIPSTLILIFSLLLTNPAFSQMLTNNGAGILSTTDAIIYVNGGVLNNPNGTFDNSGYMEVKGDFTNDGLNTGFINSSPGLVVLSGPSQTINGSDIIKFHDLSLQGTGIKSLDIDAIVEDSLALNDRELATDINTMYVTNPDTDIITRTTGFVSSLDDGGLSRNTLSTQLYLFPVGSSAGTFRYRPVEIIPNLADSNTYKVRMANVDATSEGFDREIDDSSFCLINPEYYHRIGRINGVSPADITIFFDNVLDDNYTELGHWQNNPRWENTNAENIINKVSPTLSSIQKLGWDEYGYTPFALGKPASTLWVSEDTTIIAGDVIDLESSGAPAYYWSTGETGSIIEVGPVDTTTYFVFSDAGCTDTAFVTVNVLIENNIYIPNVFSLTSSYLDNKDLFVFGIGIKDIEFTIYDRWGEIVYQTKEVVRNLRDDDKCCTYTLGWDGKHYKSGKQLNSAVFAYVAKGNYADDEPFYETGNITLIK